MNIQDICFNLSLNTWDQPGGICGRRIAARVKGKVYRMVLRPAMMYCLETAALTKT